MDSGHVFDQWKQRNAPYLRRCAGKTLIVAYSGGKDSTVCVSLLDKVHLEYGFTVEALLYAFPPHLYSLQYRSAITAFWKSRGIPFHYHEADSSLPEIRGLPDPCLACQQARKRSMARLFPSVGVHPTKLVIVSGHSLWDLAGYAMEHLINHELAEQREQNAERVRERFLEIAQRFYPYLEMKEGYAVYRPMHFLNQEEIRCLFRESGVPPEDSPCEFAVNRPKKFLGKYFEKFGLEFSYDGVMQFAGRHLDLGDKADVERMNWEEYLGKRG